MSNRRYDSPSVPVLSPRRLFSGKRKVTRTRKTQRFAWLNRAKQRSWHISHFAAMFLLIVAITATIYVFASIDFWVYSAHVEYNRYTPAHQIYKQAGIHGYSIFFVNPGKVRERLIALDHVRDAVVAAQLPASVRIRLIEREPSIQYQVLGERRWIDEEGYITPAADDREGLIELIDNDSAASKDGRTIDVEVLRAIQHITKRLPQVTTFRYQQPFGLYFISPEGWQVYLGAADAMDDKLANWESIRKRVLQERTDVNEVDLRYERPYWR
ncbi:MAG: FtsQ-type POTRA domain-containing protein [Chloroflexi bacterium]|nr:FtsQ-type POTRA domain-containing protein [Chloroflexota bacterium]